MLEYGGAAGMSEAASEITFEDRRSVPASLTLSALRRKMEKRSRRKVLPGQWRQSQMFRGKRALGVWVGCPDTA